MSAYIFESHGKQFTPDGAVTVDSTEAHNKAIESQELAIWSQAPDSWHGYVTHPDYDMNRTSQSRDHLYTAYPRVIVSTWIGTQIGVGRVTGVSRGFNGARIVHIRITGTNGAVYHGKYGVDGGSFIRLRKSSKSSKS
jgi:hypothetical protein